jgi:hypothetical protein
MKGDTPGSLNRADSAWLFEIVSAQHTPPHPEEAHRSRVYPEIGTFKVSKSAIADLDALSRRMGSNTGLHGSRRVAHRSQVYAGCACYARAAPHHEEQRARGITAPAMVAAATAFA